MGLSLPIWQLMCKRLPRGELLSFGCPDPLFERHDLPNSKYMDQIRTIHGYSKTSPDTTALFQSERWTLTAVDVIPSRGIEKQINLNEPLPGEYRNRFDAVIDIGTGEHVFNIGQVFRSILDALRIGGSLLIEHPLVYCNHGFWGTQPTAVIDFFSQNGCKVEAWVNSFGKLTSVATHRFDVPTDRCLTVCVAVKEREVDFRWPTQSRFL